MPAHHQRRKGVSATGAAKFFCCCTIAGTLLVAWSSRLFAGSYANMLPGWAVYPAQLAWPDRPEFPSQALWPDDPRYRTSSDQVLSSRSFLSIFDPDRVSSFKTSADSNAGLLNFTIDTDFRDSTKTDGRSFLGFFLGDNSRWQENQVGYTNVKMQFGDSVRINTKFGASQYEASQAYFASLSDKKSPEDIRTARFSGVGSASGTAALSRIEEDVLRFGSGTVTLFQEFARVDPFFEDTKFSDRAFRQQTKDDVFSKPDRETAKYGVSFAQGPWGVTVSRSSISNISEDPGQFYREQRDSSKVSFALRDVYNGFTGSNTGLSNLVPTSIWVGSDRSSIRQNEAQLPLAAMNVNAGAFWQWSTMYASVSVWRFSSESSLPQVVNLPVQSVSSGTDLGLGIQNKLWNLYGYVSIFRSSYTDSSSTSGINNVNGGVSLSITVEGSPNLTLAFDVSNYGDQYDYPFLTGLDAGRYARAGAALDFSKYLADSAKRKLQLFYYAKKDTFDSRWAAVASQDASLEHVFGALMKSRW